MLNESVGSWPYRRVRLKPAKTAIRFRDQGWTYAQLDDRGTRLAHALRELGIGKGDRVALLSTNHPCYLEALFACGLLGAVFVPLNVRLASPEVAFSLEDSGVSVLVHSTAMAEVGIAATGQAGTSSRVVEGAPDSGAVGYEEIIAAADPTRIDETVTHDDSSFIMYTSGTTGRPKA